MADTSSAPTPKADSSSATDADIVSVPTSSIKSGLAPRSERTAHDRSSRPSNPPDGDEDDDENLEPLECSNTCCAIFVLILAILFGYTAHKAMQPLDPLDAKVVAFRGDEPLRVVIYPGMGGAGSAMHFRGANSKETDWAIFFYKPYCGACKRVWPAFRGLAATTNTSNRLRFGEVDCVRDRSVCSMLKADKQPLVRIYRHAEKQYTGPAKEGRLGFKREVIREWSGLLIGYEVVDWFKSLQYGPEPIYDSSADIKWPSAEALGDAMRRFKSRGRTQYDSSLSKRPKDPSGYLIDAELALTHGLTDHVFPYLDTPLEGDRLKTMLRWLDVQSHSFPKATVRSKLSALKQRLSVRNKWDHTAYEAAVKAQGFSTTPPSDSSWRWCDTGNGRGGYSCGLWVLFHATLANTARMQAPDALHTIALWVNDFFGCEECARHFIKY